MKIAIKFDKNGKYMSHCTDHGINNIDDIKPNGDGFAFYDIGLDIIDAIYFRLVDNIVTIDQEQKSADQLREINNNRIAEIKLRLNVLSQDLVQDMAGEIVPNINERKLEFITLHNELRVLEGKEPRAVMVEIQ